MIDHTGGTASAPIHAVVSGCGVARLALRLAVLALALIAAGCDSGSSTEVDPAAATPQAAVSANAAATATATDPALLRMLPPGATVRRVVSADFTRDGIEEVLVAFDPTGDAKAPGSLMILRRGVDGPYQKVVEGPRALLCRTCNGAGGDPLRALAIRGASFTIQHEGVSPDGGSWFSEALFIADEQRGTPWRLITIQDVAYAAGYRERASERRGLDDLRGLDLESFNATGMVRAPRL